MTQDETAGGGGVGAGSTRGQYEKYVEHFCRES